MLPVYLFVVLSVLSGTALVAGEGQTAEAWYEGGILAAQHYDGVEVDKCLEALGKVPAASARLQAIVVRATQLEFLAENKESFGLLREAVGGIGGLSKQQEDVVFLYWKLLAKAEDPEKAIGFLNEIAAAKQSRSKQIRCLSALAEIDLHYQRYASALANAKSAHIGAHPPKTASDSERVDEFLVQQTDDLLERIENVIEIMEHGAGFYLYNKANTLYRSKKYKDAAVVYVRLLDMHERNKGKPVVRIISPEDPRFSELPVFDVYAEAARVYLADAYFNLGDFALAAKALSPLIIKKSGPYYGEALVVQSQVQICVDGPTKDVARSLSLALDWVERESKMENDYVAYQIPEKSIARTKPAAAMRRVDDWSNVTWFEFKPNQIYNPNTCPWYKDYICYRARTLRSLVYFLNGANEKAIDDLNAIVGIDPFDAKLTQNGMPSNYLRLRDDYRGRRLFASVGELKMFEGDLLNKLALAELHLELEMLDAADRMYSLIQTSYGDKLTENQKAYIGFARASCHAFMGNTDTAVGFLKPFTSKWKDTPTAPRALLLWADYQGDPTHAAAVLDLAMKSASGTPMVREIAFRKGQILYAGGYYTDAKALILQLMQSSKDSFFTMQCKNYLDQIDKDTQARKP